ncbi:MAG: response regulator [Deltaproteobacteria bacterium]|nr:response regulator [Deltaproteobacteria bacterium]MBW2592542.1 response regulator [Deltaproteobacteria bacterium]
MSEGLDIIIVDDEPAVCRMLSENIVQFYVWGEVIPFTDVEAASLYCLNRESGIAIFIVDVFLDGKSGFLFLDSICEKYRSIYEDAIIITGNASDDIVDMCLASDINYLLEKPVRHYALQMAVRAIAWKYIKFTARLRDDPEYCRSCNRIINQ